MVNEDKDKELEYLLRNMEPVLEKQELVFCSLPTTEAEEYLEISQGFYIESEGTTVILARQLADHHGLSYEHVFRRIVLTVYSSLEAVGFLARITEVLAAQGISTNVVSAYYHDYLYILVDQAESALEILRLWQDKLSSQD